MQKNIYTAITEHLTTNVSELKQIGLYNNQFNYLGESGEVKETVIFPCAFIEFGEFDYENKSFPNQIVPDATVRIHVGIELINSNDTSIFALKNKVNYYLHGFGTSDFNKLIRNKEITDTDHPNYYVFQLEYRTSFLDNCQTYLYADRQEITLSGLTINN